jgi:hypothetical protein
MIHRIPIRHRVWVHAESIVTLCTVAGRPPRMSDRAPTADGRRCWLLMAVAISFAHRIPWMGEAGGTGTVPSIHILTSEPVQLRARKLRRLAAKCAARLRH